MDKVVVGVIGAGIMGERHSRIYSELPNAELRAVADVREDRAKAVAERCGARLWYKDYRSILEDPEVQAVSITTPDFLHLEPIKDSAAAGKHILVEKPLATDLRDADEIVRSVRASGVKLMVNYSMRWTPSYSAAKSIISSGEIGEVITANARKDDAIYVPTEMLSWASRTSPAIFLSTHDIDAVKWFIDREAKEVYACGRKGLLSARGIDTYDAIQAIVKFRGGVSAVFQSSWVYPNAFPTLVDAFVQVIGTRGAIIIDRNRQDMEVCVEGGYRYQGKDEVFGSIRGSLRLSIEHFLDCVIEDREPISSLENGRSIVEIVAAVHRSIEMGEPVKLPL
ncbi:MAG: Gfo/Idh/MocA family protein [bacterium]